MKQTVQAVFTMKHYWK